MKKGIFKKFTQAVCIAAVGLLVGSSLDYAFNNYGVLANPNVFAEDTSTTATVTVTGTGTATLRWMIQSGYTCDEEQWNWNDDLEWVKLEDHSECSRTSCNTVGTYDPCDGATGWSPWTTSYYDEGGTRHQTCSCSGCPL